MRFCILFAVAALLAAANAQTTRGGPVPTAGKTGQAQMVASSQRDCSVIMQGWETGFSLFQSFLKTVFKDFLPFEETEKKKTKKKKT